MPSHARERPKLLAEPISGACSANSPGAALAGQVTVVSPGQFHVATDGVPMTTILGSCVAVCIHDRGSAIGGMNHFLLPERTYGSEHDSPAGRYGKDALDALLSEILRAGARREHLEAKLFGGAYVIHGVAVDIGQRNAAFARTYLRKQNIRVMAEDLEGTSARKILFFPDTGRVLCKKILGDSPLAVGDLGDEARRPQQKSSTTSASADKNLPSKDGQKEPTK